MTYRNKVRADRLARARQERHKAARRQARWKNRIHRLRVYYCCTDCGPL